MINYSHDFFMNYHYKDYVVIYLDKCDNNVDVVRSPTTLMLILPNVVESVQLLETSVNMQQHVDEVSASWSQKLHFGQV